MKVTIYTKLINYQSGNTIHFEDSRFLREQELIRLLGIGQVIQRFLVDEDGNPQIQEILSNGIIRVYSAKDHKKVTTFAPGPNRLINLFEACGQIIPESLVRQSELNVENGYSNIFTVKKSP